MSRRCLPTEQTPAQGPAIPLARWADRQLCLLAAETSSQAIAALDGMTLMGERGSHNGYRITGCISTGIGGSRLMRAAHGGWFALTMVRPEDLGLMPALFMDDGTDFSAPAAIEQAVSRFPADELVARGRLLGLPCASADETPASAPVEIIARGPRRQRPAGHRPLIVDLSAIWAGPLLGHLLWQAGAEVIRVESQGRTDLIRRDDPITFGLINQGKASTVIDFFDDRAKAALINLIRRADMVIESSRPRALRHLGIDAQALVAQVPGLVWLSVTGHGANAETENWAGLGNDCGVAAGLARAMEAAGGDLGYVGDAPTDPLTAITGALAGWRALQSGEAQRIGLAMSAIGARALDEERAHDATLLNAELRAWSDAKGSLFPRVPRRPMLAECRDLGADTQRIFPMLIRPC